MRNNNKIKAKQTATVLWGAGAGFGELLGNDSVLTSGLFSALVNLDLPLVVTHLVFGPDQRHLSRRYHAVQLPLTLRAGINRSGCRRSADDY